MNILISVNTDFLEKAKTMLFSLREHNNVDITVYLLNHSLSHDNVESFSGYLDKVCQIKLIEIDVSRTDFDNMPLGELHFSIEMYYRILAQFLLPEDIGRILWLIILKDISAFYNLEFDNKFYVVCADRSNDKQSVKQTKEKVGIDSKHVYFNSGVMLMNLNKLRNETFQNDIISTCQKKSHCLTYPDQDLLNYMFTGKVKYSDSSIYNYQVKNEMVIPKDVLSKIAILHYCGPWKPWIYTDIKRSSLPYWKIRCMQGFKKEAKNTYRNLIIDKWKELVGFIKDYFRILRN